MAEGETEPQNRALHDFAVREAWIHARPDGGPGEVRGHARDRVQLGRT
jgi:hypothetical protein